MFQPADARALQTFVARLDPPGVADEHMREVLEGIARGAAAFGGKRLFDGDRRMAVVLSEVDDAVYFLHTVAASKTLGNHQTSLAAAIRATPVLGAAATVRWIRPLNRHLQRAFGWGDVFAKKADVEAAAAAAREDGATNPLRELLPWLGAWWLPPWDAARSQDREIVDILDSLPSIHAALQGEKLPELEDCEHRWLEDGTARSCSDSCRDAYFLKSFYRCGNCNAVKCRGCVEDLDEARLVEQFRKRTEPTETVFGCFAHRPHPLDPAAFFVLDSAKMSDAEKLEWVSREFLTPAQEAALEDLPNFAALCLALFGNHVHGEVPQKAFIFNLFTRYVKGRIKLCKESDVHPRIRKKLAPLWGKQTQLCHECGRVLGPERVTESCAGEERHWCSRLCEHRDKDYFFRCSDCGSSESVPGSVETKWWDMFPRRLATRTATCNGCKKEHKYDIYIRGPGSPSPERHVVGARSSSKQQLPPREPTWKRRRRV
jgi:hypothetical protein